MTALHFLHFCKNFVRKVDTNEGSGFGIIQKSIEDVRRRI